MLDPHAEEGIRVVIFVFLVLTGIFLLLRVLLPLFEYDYTDIC